MINSKQRSKLRSLAHHLKPVVNIGKSGVTEGSISSIDEALESHELIKVKFIQNKESKNKFKSEIERLFSDATEFTSAEFERFADTTFVFSKIIA